MARPVGRGTAADPRRLAGSLSHRSDDARPGDTARSYPAIARAPLLGTATPTRTVGPHPPDGAERIERSRGIRDTGSAHPGCAVARNVRLQRHAASRRWEDTCHATSPVAGAPSRPDYEGSLQLLEVDLSRSKKRTPWPLPQTFLARRSAYGAAHGQNKTSASLNPAFRRIDLNLISPLS